MKAAVWIFAVCAFTTAPLCAAETPVRPDIVVFLTDDHSQLDSTPYGDKVLHTPNMQRLADAGMTFTEAYVASPSCAPSRAALLTGLMPARNGAEPNHAHPRPDVKKWPAYFQELGYEVVAYGKVSHYKQTVEYGFDSFAHDTFHDEEAIPAAAEFLKHRDPHATRPLCFMVGTNWPHVPWPKENGNNDPDSLRLPENSIDTDPTREARAKYAHAVELADRDLGIIYDTARKTLGDDTIFLMSGDHGAQWPFAKWNCYESGVKVPLIVSWPGVTKPGSRTDAWVSWIDFMPTLLEVAGGKAPADIDGKSFVGVLKGTDTRHRDRIFTAHSGDGNWNIYPMRAVRKGNWKYIRNLHPDFAFTTHIDLPGKLARTKYWESWEAAAETSDSAKAIVTRYRQRPAEELYDLSTDPFEKHNLASDAAASDKKKELGTELDEWLKREGDQLKVYGKPRMLNDPASYGAGAWPAE